MSDLFDGHDKTVLHVAPEPQFEVRLREALGTGYVTADLYDPRVMVKMDITAIEMPDDSFDVILCSHVLEHVDDDRRAMRELHRVLKPDGWALLLVPISGRETYENPDIIDPDERTKHFGQHDHVRRYGNDYVERLRESGFKVEVLRPSDFIDSDNLVRLGVDIEESLFCCRK
jgi:SAM-dependent methyltransferase